MWRRVWFQVGLITIIALGIRLVWGFSQLSLGIEFVDEGDYALYRIGAEHLLTAGDFSNSLFLVRPPAFSILIALLNQNNTLILLFNSVLGALLVPLTCVLARQIRLAQPVALLAGIIVALDPLSVKYTAFLGPEPLAFVGALAMVVCLLRVVQVSTVPQRILWGLAAAACLLISVYARPSIYLVWLLLVPWLLLVNRRAWPGLLVYALVSLGGMQVWVAHNARIFNNPTFSTVAAYTMTYYRAVSVANLATDMSVREVELDIARRVEEKLGRDPSLVNADTKHGYLAASPQVERALNEVSLEIFRQYPLTYLATIPVGFVRLYQLIPPTVPPLSGLLDWQYYPAILWNWVILLVGIWGLYRAARNHQWMLFWCVFLLFGYFTGGTLLSKSAGLSGRERTIIIPFLALACAYGVIQTRHWWQQRRMFVARSAADRI